MCTRTLSKPCRVLMYTPIQIGPVALKPARARRAVAWCSTATPSSTGRPPTRVWRSALARLSLRELPAVPDMGLGYQALLKDLGIEAPLRVWTDSSAAIGICSRQGLGKLKHLDTHTLWIQQAVRLGRVELRTVDGEVDPADFLTNHSLSRKRLEALVKLHGCEYMGGAPSQRPRLAKALRAKPLWPRHLVVVGSWAHWAALGGNQPCPATASRSTTWTATTQASLLQRTGTWTTLSTTATTKSSRLTCAKSTRSARRSGPKVAGGAPSRTTPRIALCPSAWRRPARHDGGHDHDYQRYWV